MTATLGRLVRFARVSPWRIAVSAVLGVLAVGFGVALMTAAGYLISRAAEQPRFSLTVTIVAVGSSVSRGRSPVTSTSPLMTSHSGL
jgi:ABC-type transport system involved in cytochrome bd biosynthesis fused ATPase/permease subunit